MQSGAFCQEIDVFQFSTFVNENITIMLDSGIDTVASYYFNFFSSMNALCFVL